MIKFALFLVCALVAVQGFQAHSVEPTNRGYDEIQAIQDALAKLVQIFDDAISEFTGFIQNINDMGKDIVEKIPLRIQDIKQRTEELIHLAEEIGQKCLAAHKDKIDALDKFAQDGVQDCIKEAGSHTEALKKQIKVFGDQTNALRKDVENRVGRCLHEQQDPIAVEQCLKEQIELIKDKSVVLEKEIVNTIALAKETAEKAGSVLVECASKLNKEVDNMENKLRSSIWDCARLFTYCKYSKSNKN